MKRILSLSIVALALSTAFVACKKAHVCTCTETYTPVGGGTNSTTTSTTTFTSKLTKKEARMTTQCYNFTTTNAGGSYDYKCTLN